MQDYKLQLLTNIAIAMSSASDFSFQGDETDSQYESVLEHESVSQHGSHESEVADEEVFQDNGSNEEEVDAEDEDEVVEDDHSKKRKQNYVFVINNYTPKEVKDLKAIKCDYLAFGFEIGPEKGTPHLQVFIKYKSARTLSAARHYLTKNGLRRAADHEVAAFPISAIRYALKGADPDHPYWQKYPYVATPIFEKGNRPVGPKQAALTKSQLWAGRLHLIDTTGSSGDPYTDLAHHRVIAERHRIYKDAERKKIKLCRINVLRPWQQGVIEIIDEPPHQRHIHWYVDAVGGQGKSEMATYLEENRDACILESAKGADLAHLLPDDPKIIVFNFTRQTEDYINYSFIEKVKDGRVLSTKYQGAFKKFARPHVFVFANFQPSPKTMSDDKWVIHNLI